MCLLSPCTPASHFLQALLQWSFCLSVGTSSAAHPVLSIHTPPQLLTSDSRLPLRCTSALLSLSAPLTLLCLAGAPGSRVPVPCASGPVRAAVCAPHTPGWPEAEARGCVSCLPHPWLSGRCSKMFVGTQRRHKGEPNHPSSRIPQPTQEPGGQRASSGGLHHGQGETLWNGRSLA